MRLGWRCVKEARGLGTLTVFRNRQQRGHEDGRLRSLPGVHGPTAPLLTRGINLAKLITPNVLPEGRRIGIWIGHDVSRRSIVELNPKLGRRAVGAAIPYPAPTGMITSRAVVNLSLIPRVPNRSGAARHRWRRRGDDQSHEGECRGGSGRTDSREPPSGRGSGQSPRSVCFLIAVRLRHDVGLLTWGWVCLRRAGIPLTQGVGLRHPEAVLPAVAVGVVQRHSSPTISSADGSLALHDGGCRGAVQNRRQPSWPRAVIRG
jgi:hypothetical protein